MKVCNDRPQHVKKIPLEDEIKTRLRQLTDETRLIREELTEMLRHESHGTGQADDRKRPARLTPRKPKLR
jgi:hypothetical protein